MSKTIRIGTRDSELAIWQATSVKQKLEKLGFKAELIPIKSTGDLVLDKPLYELGITGIFTKSLDVAMLNGTVDIAVHSMKDVPTLLPKGIIQAAVLERGSSEDILITNGVYDTNLACTIATGSLRRKAQWLHKFPHHQIVGLRGNVNLRLQKLKESRWQGAIFAKAGLDRIDLLPKEYVQLDWMIPPPAQGAIVVVVREDDPYCEKATSKLNHVESQICTHIEREFLRVLEGGCTAPIGAYATIKNNKISFTGVLLSLNGKTRLVIKDDISKSEFKGFGAKCAEKILAKGGKELMQQIKDELY